MGNIPLDPTKGKRYTKIVRAEDEIDQIYKLTLHEEDCINPTEDENLTWEKDSSFFSDSDEEVEKWKNWLHEVYALRCNRIT